MYKKVLFFALVCLCCLQTYSQTIDDVQVQYNEFAKMQMSGVQGVNSYNALYLCYENCIALLDSSSEGTSEWQLSRQMLYKIHPYFPAAAYWFWRQKDRERTTDFAEAYVNIRNHKALASEKFENREDYATFAWMAATRAFNSENYAKAVTYLDAYIKSDYADKREDAYRFLAGAYIKLNDKMQAKYVLDQGLMFYPENVPMLKMAINLLAELKNDDLHLQKYITQLIKIEPQNEALLNIQAQLYERSKEFEKAIQYYQKLKELKPQNLEIARHLAVDNYNAGVMYVEKMNELKIEDARKNKKEINKYEEIAKSYFLASADIFNQVLFNDPLAINYAYALANAYAYLGDQENLNSVNEKIVTLGHQPVMGEPDMKLMNYNRDTAKVSLVSNVSDKSGNSYSESDKGVNSNAMILSDVDMDIPENHTKNSNTLVLIIANEDYAKVAKVPNADHDGSIFALYCNRVLGVPEESIRQYHNVTYGELLDAIEDMKSLSKYYRRVIVYYAGHGIPDDDTKTAYILPVDADGKQLRVCYPLSELYGELAELEVDYTTVFIDACFSGATRKDEMVMSARAVAIDVDDDEIEGKVVVFSAATGSQTALSYDEQHHGMFTYYLLKKLKETNGEVTLSELGNYITENVSRQSRLINHKDQTPTVVVGYGFGDEWQLLKLK